MVSRHGHDRHVALVVEDDLVLAEALGDLLKSLGHDVMHAETQEEGLKLMEQGGFCFAILDLQIKVNEEAVHAWVEAGQTLMRRMRELFPHRNRDDHHYLQILAMSGYAKERWDVIRMLQDGADDFVVKPLGDNNPPLHAKIQECLRKSGRERHKDCPAMMKLAKRSDGGQAVPVADGGKVRGGMPLVISGDLNGKRTGIRVGDKPVFLTNASFLVLLKLVAHRIGNGDGWIHKVDLGADSEGWKGISRLNRELRPFLPDRTDVHENDKQGGYRLNPILKPGDVDHERLADHWQKEVRAISIKIHQLRQVGQAFGQA